MLNFKNLNNNFQIYTHIYIYIKKEHVLGADWSPGLLTGEVPGALLRVQTAITDIIRGIMPTEEQLPRVIRQRDPLGGNFEMDYSRGGQWFLLEHRRHRLLDGLRPRQRFHVHGEEVQNIAGWREKMEIR